MDRSPIDPRGFLHPWDFVCRACQQHRHEACDWLRGCECLTVSDACIDRLTRPAPTSANPRTTPPL